MSDKLRELADELSEPNITREEAIERLEGADL